MKKISLVFLVVLSGCSLQQLNNDMMDNKFFDHSPINNSLFGTYTAPMGPFLSTYVINADGTGVNCYFHNGSAILHQIKVYSEAGQNSELITETGLKSKLTKNSDGTVTITSYGNSFTLQSDPDLKMANLSCKEKLTN